jgi:hypothetical protein
MNTILLEVLNKYYNKDIQLNIKAILDITKEISKMENPKMLVFGLGYDSELWYNLTNKNTYFIEHDMDYINKTSVDKDHIIFHPYENMSVTKSFTMSDDDIAQQSFPKGLLELAPFDIIVIDGPTGWLPNKPGRLLSYFWTKNYLSHSDTIIYCDDTERPLETYCLNKYFKDYQKLVFTRDRQTTTKVHH